MQNYILEKDEVPTGGDEKKKLVVAIFRQTARRNLWNCNSLPQYFIATQELNISNTQKEKNKI